MNLTNFTKMKVSYACQVLSKSVAAGMTTHVSFKSLPADAADTANFIDTMDQVIDCFNSRGTLMSKLKPYKNAMSAKSPHVKFLTGILEWIEEWKFVGPKAELPSVFGLKLTISALLRLWNDLQTHHTFAFLLTSRLNQDCLENFYCIIANREAPAITRTRNRNVCVTCPELSFVTIVIQHVLCIFNVLSLISLFLILINLHCCI